MTRAEHYLISYEKQQEFLQQYREALKDSISLHNMTLLYLSLDSWSPQVNHEIFEDQVHLNDNGFVLLDKAIANLIATDYRTK